jgi:hypothetical protein
MNWSEFFPIMTDEMVEEFQNKATPAEKERLEVDSVINARPEATHVMSVTLFWKHVDAGDPDLPEPTEEILRQASELGLVKRFSPWQHYVEPLLTGAERIRQTKPHVVVVVWLAADLRFLIPALIAVGCEVRLMKSSSLRHSPGAMWRFLALEDARLVTVVDSDDADKADIHLARTEQLPNLEQSSWKSPNGVDEEINGAGYFIYKPIIASGFGSRIPQPARLLLDAFIWHSLKGTFPLTVCYPKRGVTPIFGAFWPGYCFDEWFLACAVYPRLAVLGLITYHGHEPRGYAFTLDVEYATWLNPLHCLAFPFEPQPLECRPSYDSGRPEWGLP